MTIQYTTSSGLSELGGYAVSITDTNGVPYPDGSGTYAAQTRTFPIDTSFEPYRREAFRHRSIPGQREAIQITNIMGEGTVNTEGLWRREMREFQEGAGQQYLDHKEGDSAARFFSSKGVDVFSYPYQAKLLPDTYRMDTTSSPASNIMSVVASGYMVVVSGTTVTYYTTISTVGSAWTGATTMSFTGTAPTTIYDIATDNTNVYLATNNGLWYAQPGTSSFNVYATGNYTMVAWANNQLIASNAAELFAFQPRSSTVAPLYGSQPTVSVVPIPITGMSNIGYVSVSLASGTNSFVVGQSLTIQNTQTFAEFTSISVSGATVTATCASGTYHGLQVGNTIAVVMGYSTGASITETVMVTATPSTTTFKWNSTKSPSATNFNGGTATATTSQYNGTWNVTTVEPSYLILQQAGGITPANTAYGSLTIGGSIGGSQVPDLLVTNPDPNWVWSGAVGGETQVYFSGYSSHTIGGVTYNYNGCIYRSDLLGSSTTSTTDTQTITTAQVAQPWQLVSPVQALPMSPDEYPTCIQSYLNYIFIGTNRGIRMAQTLSIYDPTATATGDLKAGPLIPNILQPVSNPVTAIIGDGRFVWFAWSNYDSTSTGLGRLDLTTYIAGDPLAPVYASDLMVTGQGIINSLAWNPVKNVPTIAVAGLGVYEPNGVNVNGVITVTSTQGKFVTQGSLTSSIFDYGIPDQKAPVYFEYGGVTPTNTNLQATVICEPQESFVTSYVINTFNSPTSIGTATKEYAVGASPKSSQFQVLMHLNTTASNSSPTLYRWTLKSFPNVVSGTDIMVVLQLFSVNVVDGEEVYVDPYDNFYWLESLRQAQNLVTYTEGPLSTSTAIIESLDWIPHKRRDNYENGFEGDCVVTLKTLGPYTYTRPST